MTKETLKAIGWGELAPLIVVAYKSGSNPDSKTQLVSHGASA